MFDILEDCLFVQAHCTHEISNRPYSPSSPVPLPDEFELLIQSLPRVLFDNLDHLRNNVLGWKANHDMHVVGLDISFQILDFWVHLSNFVHLNLQVLVDTVHQDFVSVSGNPDDVIHTSVGTVGLFSDIHVWILSYLSEDLGTHSIHGLTSGDMRRYFKKTTTWDSGERSDIIKASWSVCRIVHSSIGESVHLQDTRSLYHVHLRSNNQR